MSETLLEVANKCLSYDPETGKFSRKEQHKVDRYGPEVGHVTDQGYWNVHVAGAHRKAHRLAWLMMTGHDPLPNEDIDHINGNRIDNRWANLRIATRSQNQMNRGLQTSNKSGHRGVSFRKDTGKWHARVNKNGKAILLGDFVKIEDAIAARDAGERLHFGEYSGIGREMPSVKRHGRPDYS